MDRLFLGDLAQNLKKVMDRYQKGYMVFEYLTQIVNSPSMKINYPTHLIKRWQRLIIEKILVEI